MAMATRAERLELELRVGPLAEGDLRVARAQGREALSTPFEVQVDFETRDGQPVVPADLVGQAAQLTLRSADGVERFVNGLCEAVELTAVRKGTPLYRLRLVPRLALLAHRSDARVFQGKRVPAVVKEVLDGLQVPLRLDLQGSYPTREFCVQYRETDLAFVSRLLAEEGIFWFFEQSDGAHTLVLADAPGAFADIPGDAALPFRPPQGGGPADAEHLSALEWSGRIRPLKVTLRDFDQARPGLDLTQAVTGSGADPIEVYEYRLRSAQSSDLGRLARTRLEQERVDASVLAGESDSLRLTPGTCFEATEHPDPALNQRIQVTSLTFEAARAEDRALGLAAAHAFRCRWEGQPAGTPFRPPRAAARRPAIGTQTATVVGPKGEEIHVDEGGRVKVQFHWDRLGGRNEKSSCFVRVAQAWAGSAWGASFIPRVGQEVLVRFLDGDPERPLVVGALYNGRNSSPIALPDDKTRSTLRTDSSLRGQEAPGFNELGFEDAKGSEEVLLHAQKDEQIVVLNDKAQRVGTNESLQVEKDRTQKVGGHQSLQVNVDDASQVAGDQQLRVGKDRSTITGPSHDERVAGAQSISVGGSRTVTVGVASAVSVGAAAALTVGGGLLIVAGGVQNTAVGGARLEQVGGAKTVVVAGAQEETVGQDASSTVGGDNLAQVVGQLSVSTDKDSKADVSATEGLMVKEASAWLAKSLQLEADELKIVVGGNLLLQVKKSGQVTFSSANFTVDGSQITTKGSKIEASAGEGPSSGSATVAEAKELKEGDKTVVVTFSSGGKAACVGLAFEVTLPDGAKKQGEVSASGLSLGGVKAGSSKLAFTGLDEGSG